MNDKRSGDYVFAQDGLHKAAKLKLTPPSVRSEVQNGLHGANAIKPSVAKQAQPTTGRQKKK